MLGLNRMVLQRFLGHREMPGFEKWRYSTEENASCWKCDKWTYTIILWSRPFANNYQNPTVLDDV